MDKQDARRALSGGAKLTHRNFTAKEWVKLADSGNRYEFEDGVKQDIFEFWAMRTKDGWLEGWSIFNT